MKLSQKKLFFLICYLSYKRMIFASICRFLYLGFKVFIKIYSKFRPLITKKLTIVSFMSYSPTLYLLAGKMRLKRLQKIVAEGVTEEKVSKQSKRTSYWGSHLDTSFSLLVLILSICYYYFGIDFKYGVFKYWQVLISIYY